MTAVMTTVDEALALLKRAIAALEQGKIEEALAALEHKTRSSDVEDVLDSIRKLLNKDTGLDDRRHLDFLNWKDSLTAAEEISDDDDSLPFFS